MKINSIIESIVDRIDYQGYNLKSQLLYKLQDGDDLINGIMFNNVRTNLYVEIFLQETFVPQEQVHLSYGKRMSSEKNITGRLFNIDKENAEKSCELISEKLVELKNDIITRNLIQHHDYLENNLDKGIIHFQSYLFCHVRLFGLDGAEDLFDSFNKYCNETNYSESKWQIKIYDRVNSFRKSIEAGVDYNQLLDDWKFENLTRWKLL